MPRPYRVVLIEDNAPIRRLTSILLREAGYRVLIATTGEDGVELILHDRPELVLLDLTLPGIDGYEVLARVRNSEDAKDATVVAYTAIVVPGERERILAAGFDGCIEKPIDPLRFPRDVATVLTKMQRSA